MVYLLLGQGFEEIEAVTPVDILRRCGVEVKTVGIGGLYIVGAHGIVVAADCTVDEIDQEKLEMLIIPGGLGGVASISADPDTMAAIGRAYREGKYLAAICAGPTILAAMGITDGKQATSYPGTEAQMGDACYRNDAAVVVDGKVITSRSPGTAMVFALKLAEVLCDGEAVRQVKEGLVLC